MSLAEVDARAQFPPGKKIVVAFAIALRKLWPSSVEPPVVVIYDRDARELSMEREGIEEQCDSLVAADGASSKIRATMRPDGKLQSAEVVQMVGTARFEATISSPPDTSYGSVLIGIGATCFFSRVDQDTVVWGLSGVLEAAPRPKHEDRDP
ncbi:hypothetical protein GGR51DRAFT_562341 [Nemania sp. FL0031]|nr:hypothetical protein GGR51DRAFT_562341 [Nemania sp. FL0031]